MSLNQVPLSGNLHFTLGFIFKENLGFSHLQIAISNGWHLRSSLFIHYLSTVLLCFSLRSTSKDFEKKKSWNFWANRLNRKKDIFLHTAWFMQGFCKALFRSVFCESHGHKKTIRFCRYLIWHWLIWRRCWHCWY